MENKTTKQIFAEHQKDWRDSKIFKGLMYILMGSMIYGSGKLYKHIEKESDKEVREKYGWLTNYPIEFQRSVITSNVNKEIPWWAGNNEFRLYAVRVYLNEVRKIRNE